MKSKYQNKIIKFILGQSMFEVVLALGVVTTIVVGIVILSTNSIKNTQFSKNKNIASKYAQEGIEWLRNERDNDPDIFSANVTSVNVSDDYDLCLDTLSWSNTSLCGENEKIAETFSRNVYFVEKTISSKDILEIGVVVSWEDSSGYHESKSVTEFSDLRDRF